MPNLRTPTCVIALLLLSLPGLPVRGANPSTRPTPKFLRFVQEDNGDARLEAAIVRYQNDAGVTVDLISALHVAEGRYYRKLNQRFEEYDALLYEMVKSADAPVPGAGARAEGAISGLQRIMQDLLALEFQLDAIDYTRPNFVHADLTAEAFFQLMEDRGESLLTILIRAMLHEMARQRAGDAGPQPTVFDLMEALTAPDGARQLKLMLAPQMEDLEAITAGIEGPNGSVLLGERNKAAVAALERSLEAGNDRIGIFYGAAHMPDLHKRLAKLGFEAKARLWMTAWDMPAPPNRSTKPAPRQRP